MTENNFCHRCGKRLTFITDIHTCTIYRKDRSHPTCVDLLHGRYPRSGLPDRAYPLATTTSPTHPTRTSQMMYRKKPVVIEALQWDGSMDGMIAINKHWPLLETTGTTTNKDTRTVFMWNIKTLEGQHRVSIGDYIIKGVKGEFYPCKPDIFAMTYESALAAQPAKHEPIDLLARLDAAESSYVESVRLHNLTLDELRASESENFQADAHKLALVLEALLMSTKDDSACAKWWDMAHHALDQHRQLVDKTYPQEYVSAFGKD